MTCVVAAKDKSGRICMAADSQLTGGTHKYTEGEKLFINGDVVIGCSGDARICNILKYNFDPPPLEGLEEEIDTYVYEVFIDALRACLLEQGFAVIDANKESNSSEIIIAVGGKIYSIDATYCVVRHQDFVSVGSGMSYAYGSFYSTSGDILKRCKKAIKIATTFDVGCGGETVIYDSNDI